MAGIALDRDPERPRLVTADHDADVAALAVEHRRLLDVQLEIGVERALAQRRGTGIANPVERLLDGDARIVCRRQHALETEHLGEGHRAHHRRRKAAALFVGPADHLDAALGRETAVVEGAHHFEAAQHAQDAVVAAAADLRVEVTADRHWRQRRIGARTPREDVAQPIDLDRATGGLGPIDEQVAHLLVFGRQSQPAQADVTKTPDLGRFLQRVPQPFGVYLQRVNDHVMILRVDT